MDQKSAFWTGKRVFVTGATGLLGARLTVDLLREGAQVVALVRDADPASELVRSGVIQQTTVVSGSLEDMASVERAINEHEVDTVFHLGAQTIVGTAFRNPVATFESNIRGTWHILEACRRQSGLVKRVVVASSDKAYGIAPVLPYHEDLAVAGQYPYDVSKSCADLISRSYYHTYGLPVAIARCGNLYGGGDLNWSRIVPGTIRSLLAGERPVIRSNGKFTRDYVYVGDASDAYLRLAECLNRPGVTGEAFNFGPESPLTVLQMVAAIQRVMDVPDLEPIVLNQASAEIPDQYLSSEKARTVLGWTPSTGLDQGLRETADWYRQYLGASSKAISLHA